VGPDPEAPDQTRFDLKLMGGDVPADIDIRDGPVLLVGDLNPEPVFIV
jgi:hypothetical protein